MQNALKEDGEINIGLMIEHKIAEEQARKRGGRGNCLEDNISQKEREE